MNLLKYILLSMCIITGASNPLKCMTPAETPESRFVLLPPEHDANIWEYEIGNTLRVGANGRGIEHPYQKHSPAKSYHDQATQTAPSYLSTDIIEAILIDELASEGIPTAYTTVHSDNGKLTLTVQIRSIISLDKTPKADVKTITMVRAKLNNFISKNNQSILQKIKKSISKCLEAIETLEKYNSNIRHFVQKSHAIGISGQHRNSITIEQKEYIISLNKKCDEEEQCSICFENINKGDVRVILPCNHHYHKECIHTWLIEKIKNTCPCCRQEVFTEYDVKHPNERDLYFTLPLEEEHTGESKEEPEEEEDTDPA